MSAGRRSGGDPQLTQVVDAAEFFAGTDVTWAPRDTSSGTFDVRQVLALAAGAAAAILSGFLALVVLGTA